MHFSFVWIKQLIIIDIGGYFANTIKYIHEHNTSLEVIGYVEDTENGHQKYALKLNKASKSVGIETKGAIYKALDYQEQSDENKLSISNLIPFIKFPAVLFDLVLIQ